MSNKKYYIKYMQQSYTKIKTSKKQNYKQYCSKVVPEGRGILTVYTFYFYDDKGFFFLRPRISTLYLF